MLHQGKVLPSTPLCNPPPGYMLLPAHTPGSCPDGIEQGSVPPSFRGSRGESKHVIGPFTLQDLGNLGEVVGALGVILTLAYLAKQMQQNTTSVRAASFNSMVQNSLRLLEHSFIDSEFARFLHRAENDPSALEPDEVVRWDAYMTAVYRHFGNLVYQYRVGALDREMWESYERTLEQHLEAPSWRSWFIEHKSLFSEALVDHIESKLALRGWAP